jgi:hypothetical protein
VVASSEFSSRSPNLEEVDEVATFSNFMNISRPKSAIHMNELVDLERNESASHCQLTFELAHDAL